MGLQKSEKPAKDGLNANLGNVLVSARIETAVRETGLCDARVIWVLELILFDLAYRRYKLLLAPSSRTAEYPRPTSLCCCLFDAGGQYALGLPFDLF